MSPSSLRTQAQQFIASQRALLRGELATRAEVAASLRALDPALAAEVVRLSRARSSGRLPKKTGHLREQRTARSSGTLVGLYDCAHPDSLIPAEDGGRWAAVCEEHGTLLQADRYEIARWALSHPEEFCEVCAAWIEARSLAAAGEDTRPTWQIVRELLGPSNAYAPSGP